jgi:hypothetical protein
MGSVRSTTCGVWGELALVQGQCIINDPGVTKGEGGPLDIGVCIMDRKVEHSCQSLWSS